MQIRGVELVKVDPGISVRHCYDGLQDQISQLTGLDCTGDPGCTKQADAEDCDINKILARYAKTGVLPDLIKANPKYGDFSDVTSFMDACAIVSLAEEQFAALDAPIRKRFDNDPAKFLEFASDPKNVSEMVKMGLAVESKVVEASPPSQPASAAVAASGAPVKDDKGES